MTTECPNCRRLQAELASLQAHLEKAQAKIAALEAELRRGRRQAAPFSRDNPKPDPKPPGRRPGQGQFSYRALAQVLQEALIAEGRRFTDPDNARFAKRLRKQRRHLLRFLQVEGVEATNNRAERALRPAVIVRKRGG